jgi:nucleotide-binding universal stress UspA family protein
VTPRKILVPIDFSSGAAAALKYASELAARLPRTELVLLHVLEPVTPLRSDFLEGLGLAGRREWAEVAQRKLDALAKKTASATRRKVGVLLRQGRPFEEILKATVGSRSDLIVMGNVGYNSLHFSILGTTAERVARHAPCPVLLVGGTRTRRRAS